MTRYFNPVVSIGSILAVGSGLVSYFAGENNIIFGVLIGLQVQILTLATEIIITLKDKAIIAGRLARLLDDVETVPWMPQVLMRICDAAVKVHQRYGSTIAPIAAKRVLALAERELRQLESGFLYVDCYDPSLKLQLLGGPPSTLRAMSVQDHDLSWHLSEVGHNYWRAQLDALNSGWQVRRVFVYTEWADELQLLVDEQKAAGVVTMRVRQSDLPNELRALDVTIWGTEHAFEHQKMQMGTTTVDKLTVDSEDIGQYLTYFRTLEALAEMM